MTPYERGFADCRERVQGFLFAQYHTSHPAAVVLDNLELWLKFGADEDQRGEQSVQHDTSADHGHTRSPHHLIRLARIGQKVEEGR